MNEITKKQKCVCIRNGLRIWMDFDTAEKLQGILDGITEHRFIKYGERTMNTADVMGIFPSEDMELIERKERGEWQCDSGHWNAKGTRRCEGGKGHCYF